MKILGIYRIKNLITQDSYIGSSVDINKRWKRHKRALKNSIHHSIILQRAWNKYGEENFVMEQIELCEEKEDLKDREIFI